MGCVPRRKRMESVRRIRRQLLPGGSIKTSTIQNLAPAAALLLALVTLPVTAQPAGTAPAAEPEVEVAGPFIQPRAADVLRKACDFLAAKRSFRVHAEVTFDEVFRSGPLVHRSRGMSMLLQRPDRLYLESHGDKGRRKVYYDGASVTIADTDAKLYGRFEAPATIEEMLDDAMVRFDVALPLADLASADPCAALEGNAERGWYLGEHYFAGERSHHLFLSAPDVDVQLWIATGEEPVLRKIVLTYTSEPDKPRYGVVLDDWDFSPRHDANAFTFTPPADMRQIEFVVRAAPEAPPPEEKAE